MVQALSDNWNNVLFGGNSTLLLSEMDGSTFYSKMEASPTQIEMGFVSYGMDHFDASNMLSVYKTGGRHDWDKPSTTSCSRPGRAAASVTAERQAIYTKAQTLLTQQAPGVFVFHGLDAFLYAPFIQGSALAKNSLGYDGYQWPGYVTGSASQDGLYVATN